MSTTEDYQPSVYKITGGSGRLNTLILDQQMGVCNPRTLLGDPIIMLCYERMHVLSVQELNSSVLLNQTDVPAIDYRASFEHSSVYTQGFAKLVSLYRKRNGFSPNAPWVSSRWTPRYRASLSGFIGTLSPTLTTVGSLLPTAGFSLPAGIGSVYVQPIAYKIGATTYHHVTFDGLADFVRQLIELYGTTITFRRTASYMTTTVYVSGLSVSESQISYTARGTLAEPSYTWTTPDIRVIIRPFKDGSNLWISNDRSRNAHTAERGISLSLHGLSKGLKRNGSNYTGTYQNWREAGIGYHSIQPSTLQHQVARYDLVAQHQLMSTGMTLNMFRPALYYTQADAYNKVVQDISRNFETAYELPGTIEMISSFANWDQTILDFRNWYKAFDSVWDCFLKAKDVVKWASSQTLQYSFAISPLFKQVNAELALYQNTPKSFGQEAAFTLSGKIGDNPQFEEDVLTFPTLARAEDPILSYEMFAKSYVVLDLPVQTVVEYYMNQNVFSRLGLVPEPHTWWEVFVPFSFAIDWRLQVAKRMKAAEAWLNSSWAPIRSVTHTVSLKVVYSSGLHAQWYIRSKDEDQLCDPPASDWLIPDLPPISIPLAISVLMK